MTLKEKIDAGITTLDEWLDGCASDFVESYLLFIRSRKASQQLVIDSAATSEARTYIINKAIKRGAGLTLIAQDSLETIEMLSSVEYKT